MLGTKLVKAAAGNAGAEADEYFNQTTLLLHGDGTNGAQNNTFLDSSTPPKTITRNGNTTQGTFSPFSNADGEWSAYFDGSNDYIYSVSTDFDVATGDWTVAGWIYPTSTLGAGYGNFTSIIGSWSSNVTNSGSAAWSLAANSSGYLAGYVYSGGTSYSVLSAATVPLNQWSHAAFVRSGNDFYLYLNGVRSSMNHSITLQTQGRVYIGGCQVNSQAGYQYPGYISNVQFVKGTAVYTSASITPPTSPLTDETNTKLLTLQSNRFVDNNTQVAAKTFTINSSPSIQPFSPFAPSAAYDPAVNGGSGYFDGSGDYLVTSGGNLGSGDFTVQFWINPSVQANYAAVMGTRQGTSWYTGEWSVDLSGSGLYFIFATYATGSTPISIPNFAWTHISYVRSSGSVKTYKNGVLVATDSNSDNYTTSTIGIGNNRNGNASPFYTGYLAGLQLLPGVVLYSSDFTVPTAPPTVASGTSLLLNFTNAGVIDSTGKNNLETVGNAQVASVVKYGTGSMKFDGSGDYLRFPTSNFFNPYQGEYTVEMWIYPTSISSGGSNSSRYGTLLNQEIPGSSIQWGLGFNSSGQLIYTYWNGSATQQITHTTETISINTWVHVGFTYTSSGIALFVNGVFKSATAMTGTPSTSTTNPMYIGLEGRTGGGELYYQGYIDDLRITKGVARYTANFTPPDKALPDQ